MDDITNADDCQSQSEIEVNDIQIYRPFGFAMRIFTIPCRNFLQWNLHQQRFHIKYRENILFFYYITYKYLMSVLTHQYKYKD